MGSHPNQGEERWTMAEETAYCVKCRKKSPIKNAQEVKMKNGRPAIKGVCADCGVGVYKILTQKK